MSRSGNFRRALAAFAIACSLALVARAAPPDYLREAISRMNSDAPRGWAYTLTTTRQDDTTVERYDPSRPKGGEWTLVQTNGRAPTAEEVERYVRYKASHAPTAQRGTFERGDLDIESAEFLREDAERAEFRLRFRGDVSEPVLAHVVLELKVRKQPAAVEESVLRLARPFNPALGVRMQALVVTTTFSAPTADAPALPREVTSHFRGRMFLLVPIEEDLRVVYSDFARAR